MNLREVRRVAEEVWKVEIPQVLHLLYPIILHHLEQSKPHTHRIPPEKFAHVWDRKATKRSKRW